MSGELTRVEQQPLDVPKKAPLIAGNRGLTFSSLAEMWRFCEAVVNSGQFGRDINTPEVALIRLQAGMELGLTPIWSLTNIFVVNGKPTVYGDALLGIVRAHKDFGDMRERIEGEGDDMVAICEIDRKGQTTTVRRFSVRDAKKAGLWGKSGPWTQYPQRMLAMRARSFACRDAFADALRGLGVNEEMRDVEPRPIQAREVERPKPVLPEGADLPVPVLADSSEPRGVATETVDANLRNEARESTTVSPPQGSTPSDSRGGQLTSEETEERNPDGTFKF